MKKTISVLILILSVLAGSMQGYSARLVTLYSNITETKVADGITAYNYKVLSTAGWIDFDVVKADLTNEKIKFEPVFSEKGADTLTTTVNLANQNNAIATVNADFFAWSNKSGKGSPVGILVKDGELISSPANNGEMSAIIQYNNDETAVTYPQSYCSITADDGESMIIEYVNKFTDLSNPVIFNNKFTDKSMGAGGGVCEAVVVNGVLKEVRTEGEPLVLEDNMDVITFLGDRTTFMFDKFKIGDKVNVEYIFTPELKDIKHAIGAGTQLVKDGKATEITHQVSGANPRSAAGFDKSGNTLFLITVDGRGESRGISLEGLQEFMLSIGVWDGVNFDGGGSSVLAVRGMGEKSAMAINNPSENRAVSNALAILPTGYTGKINGIKVSSANDKVFTGTGVELDVKAFDEYYNYCDIDTDSVKFSVSGVDGNFEGNVFRPSGVGDALITAEYKGIKSDVKIKVLDYPVEIEIYPSHIDMKEFYTVTVIGYDENGYGCPISFSDTNIVLEDWVAVRDGNKVVKTGFGTVEMRVSYGYASAFAVVSTVGESQYYKTSPSIVKEDYLRVGDSTAESFTVSGGLSFADEETELPVRKKAVGILNESKKHFFTGIGLSADNLYGVGGENTVVSGFGTKNDNYVTYIWIDNSNGGMFNTDKQQWNYLTDAIKKSDKKNFVIMLQKDLYGGGSSGSRETEALFDLLEKNITSAEKNCFVFAGSGKYSARAIKGVRYFTVESMEDLENSNTREFVKVFATENSMTYTVKKSTY